MKVIAALLLILCFVFFCGEDKPEVREEIYARHKNGQKKIVLKYSITGKHEELIEGSKFDDEGHIISVVNFIENIEKRFVYSPKGVKKYEVYFKDGILDGRCVAWYENGKKKEEEERRKGKVHGRVMRWYENGTKRYDGYFINGSGKFSKWYKNGQKRRDGEFLENKLHGRWQTWDREGKLIEDVIYDNGELVKTIK